MRATSLAEGADVRRSRHTWKYIVEYIVPGTAACPAERSLGPSEQQEARPVTSAISRSISALVVCLAAIVVPSHAAAAALVDVESAPEQVRSHFAQQGYILGPSATWSGKVTTFTVTRPDQASAFDPLVTVLV